MKLVFGLAFVALVAVFASLSGLWYRGVVEVDPTGEVAGLLGAGWGIVFVLLGVFVGWLCWRHCGVEAERLEFANERLREEQERVHREIDALETQLAGLEPPPV